MAVEPVLVEDGPQEQVQTGQKSRRLIWDILHLYLRDTQEAIHSRSEAGGRLGLESYLCAWEVTFMFKSEKCWLQTELQEHCVWRKMPLKGGLDHFPALPPCKHCLSRC